MQPLYILKSQGGHIHCLTEPPCPAQAPVAAGGVLNVANQTSQVNMELTGHPGTFEVSAAPHLSDLHVGQCRLERYGPHTVLGQSTSAKVPVMSEIPSLQTLRVVLCFEDLQGQTF